MAASRRITGLNGGGSDGWDLFNRARAMVAAGEPVLELTIGEHDIRTDPKILDAMHRAALGGHTGYASIPGIPALRRAVAERYSRQTGMATGPENVVITAGGQAALFAAHIAVADPGETGLIIDPYYATYPGTLRAAGLTPRIVPARAEDGFQPTRAALEEAAEGARSLLINTPNNPTGAVYSADTIDVIADIVRAQDLWLISDEVYDSQVWHGAHLSPRTRPGMAERSLVVGSMSKSHAMTGSRIGWIIGPEEVIGHLINLGTNTNYGVAGFVQEAALFALGLGPSFEAEIGAPFRRRRDLLMTLLDGQQVLSAVPASGAMYAMLDVRGTGCDGEVFANRLLDAEKIAVMPGSSFGQAASGHIRVALTLPDEAFAEAAGRMITFAGRLAQSQHPAM